MKEGIFLTVAGVIGALALAPLSAPCLTGCVADDAAATPAATSTATATPNPSQPHTQTTSDNARKSEDTMFGLFSSSSANDPKQMIKDGALVIDVRTQEEWNEGHLPMAKLLPVDQLPARIKDVEAWVGGDKTKPIVVHCRSGARSGRAQAMLKNAGFTNVVNGGGYSSLR